MATTQELIAIGNDNSFRQRVRALFYLEAGVVYAENPVTANHAARALFASKIVTNQVDGGSFAPALAQRTNLVASTVTYNFNEQRIVSTATDAEIRSQIATDWNMFASV